MIKQIRNVAGAAALGATVLFSPATSALAQPQSGLVNVNVEDNNILNEALSRNRVGIGVAAQILAQVCPAIYANVGVAAQAIQAIDEAPVTCQSGQRDVTVTPVVN